jgi:ferredoxin
MFARMARNSSTLPYQDYYNKNKDLKDKDDYIRSLTPLFDKGSKYFDEIISNQAKEFFENIYEIAIDDALIEKYLYTFQQQTSYYKYLKKLIKELGAVAVGFTELDERYIYSHKGRFDYNYGKNIELDHPHVIVFLVEMNYKRMQNAPRADAIYESANQYYNAAYISKFIEKLIIQSGYKAKAHYDAHYDIILPPLAINAGLGELGRNNILITHKYGSRVRIGAITTNIPLQNDRPKNIGADKFCQKCKKCATNCPSKALSLQSKVTINGVEKWTTNVENCYTIWRKYGTDCGICMAVCPFSHKNNLFHNGIRKIVKYFPIFNKSLLFLENLLYGKKWKIKNK